jgi:hypothetical protein
LPPTLAKPIAVARWSPAPHITSLHITLAARRGAFAIPVVTQTSPSPHQRTLNRTTSTFFSLCCSIPDLLSLTSKTYLRASPAVHPTDNFIDRSRVSKGPKPPSFPPRTPSPRFFRLLHHLKIPDQVVRALRLQNALTQKPFPRSNIKRIYIPPRPPSIDQAFHPRVSRVPAQGGWMTEVLEL